MTAGLPEQADLQQMTERLLRLSQESQQRSAEFQQVSAHLAAASVTERSEQDAITVTVSSTGSLTALRLTEHARELSPDRLAAAILNCVQRAQAGIADEARRIVDETVRDDSPQTRQLADRVVDTFRTNFPAPQAAAGPPEPEDGADLGSLAEQTEGDRDQPPPPRRTGDDDEPGAPGPILG